MKTMILEKALQLFAAKGYDATSMEDIAKEVGIKKPSLYAHFSGKEEIFRKVFHEVLNGYMTFLENLVNEELVPKNEKQPLKIFRSKKKGPIEERLFRIFKNHANYFHNKEQAAFWYRVYLFPPEFIKKEIYDSSIKADMDFMKNLGGIFYEGIRSGEIADKNVDDLTLAYYYVLSGYTMSVAFYSEAGSDKYLIGPWKIFWDGIKQEAKS